MIVRLDGAALARLARHTMSTGTHIIEVDLHGLHLLAGLISFELVRGDGVLLFGGLGAGKTTLARAIIRQAARAPSMEVPSPTFSLVQTYDTPRVAIAHFDLYRLGSANEAGEIGLEDAEQTGVLIVEWPERAIELMPTDRLEVKLDEVDDPSRRRITLDGRGRWAAVADRMMELYRVLLAAGWSGAHVAFLQGDASPRRYARLNLNGRRAIVMDSPRRPDGPPIRDGLAYSRIAHIAEDVRPFVALSRYLTGVGLSAPQVLDADINAGVLVIEDLGDHVFGAELERGSDQGALWRDAVDALLTLHGAHVPATLPVGDGSQHEIPRYDARALGIETELLGDWYIPAATGAAVSESDAQEFGSLWSAIIEHLVAMPATLVLRDYHSPNLISLPERKGVANVGIIDFQDAMLGPAAYDLVSLLQDARVDVPETLETDLIARYLDAAAKRDQAFNRESFLFAYRALGAQRNTKILGIFARLARRDGKPVYLRHIPRIWRYLERDLQHASLTPLRAWYDRVLPAEVRRRDIGG